MSIQNIQMQRSYTSYKFFKKNFFFVKKLHEYTPDAYVSVVFCTQMLFTKKIGKRFDSDKFDSLKKQISSKEIETN